MEFRCRSLLCNRLVKTSYEPPACLSVRMFDMRIYGRGYSTISPRRVADDAELILTLTNSPGRWSPRLKTATLFCDVRPNRSSFERFDTPSMSTSNVLPMSF